MIKGTVEAWLNQCVRPTTKENVYIEPIKTDSIETGKATKTIYSNNKNNDKKAN